MAIPPLIHQGGGAGEEPAAVEGADSESEPPGARGLFHLRRAGETHGVQSHPADPLRQSQRKPQGLTYAKTHVYMHEDDIKDRCMLWV